MFSLSQKCQELEKFEVFLNNLVEESAVATEQVCLLMPGYLPQEIWESGQLKNISINLPSPFPYHHTALTQTDWHKRVKNRDPDKHI